jgi:hypothetical protein
LREDLADQWMGKCVGILPESLDSLTRTPLYKQPFIEFMSTSFQCACSNTNSRRACCLLIIPGCIGEFKMSPPSSVIVPTRSARMKCKVSEKKLADEHLAARMHRRHGTHQTREHTDVTRMRAQTNRLARRCGIVSGLGRGCTQKAAPRSCAREDPRNTALPATWNYSQEISHTKLKNIFLFPVLFFVFEKGAKIMRFKKQVISCVLA